MKPELKRIEAALQQLADQHLDVPLTPARSWAMPGTAGPAFQEKGDRAPLPYPSRPSDQPLTEAAPSLPEFAPSQALPGSHGMPQAALAINLLRDLQTSVSGWAISLEETVQQIQMLYGEGPIVDGWLESSGPDSDPTYRLCGLNQDGHPWYRPCPAEQVPDVSLAIARYQRMQLLLTRKRTLETYLAQVTEALLDIHGKLTDSVL